MYKIIFLYTFHCKQIKICLKQLCDIPCATCLKFMGKVFILLLNKPRFVPQGAENVAEQIFFLAEEIFFVPQQTEGC